MDGAGAKLVDEDTSFLGTTTTSAKTTYRGPLLALQAGAEWKLEQQIWLGGFVGAFAGSYTSASGDGVEPQTGGAHLTVLVALRVSSNIGL